MGRGFLKKDDAYGEIKRRIQVQDFKPGTFLSERELAASLGMSKTPIRSALERLQSEGFVQISPQQGAVVREPSLNEIVDMFDVRLALEPYVLHRLAGHVGTWQLERLHESLKQQEWVVEANDVRRCTQLDGDFHLMFCEFLGNEEMVRALRGLRDRLFRAVLRVFAQDLNQLRASHHDHVAIVRALEAGYGAEAVRRLIEHLEYGQRAAVAAAQAHPTGRRG
jgi:DNA-binding GntR family transcriptional regulator